MLLGACEDRGRSAPVWRRVGAVWPHSKGGGGFDLVIDDQLSVTGRIVCTEPKDDEPEVTAETA